MSKICFVCCNQCYESNADIQQKFFVTSCYHIFCAGCLANDKNFCSFCKKKCKALLIDDSLPKDVRAYFEPNFCKQLSQTLVKIHEFQTNQVRNYVDKQYSHRKRYFQTKQKITDLLNYKKQAIENIKKERAIVEKLKEGYKTNIISPQLFQMRSPANSPNGIKTPESIKNSSNSMSTTTLFNSTRNSAESKQPQPMDTSSSLTLSNFNRGISNTQKASANIVKEARKGLIANTLREMNQVASSQSRSQVRQTQNIRNYNKM